MQKPSTNAIWLICALAISGCASNGPVQLPPPPASLMVKPSYESKARQILFDLPEKQTPKSADSKK